MFAVEVEDDLTFGERMTETPERRFPDLASKICGEVATLLGGASRREEP